MFFFIIICLCGALAVGAIGGYIYGYGQGEAAARHVSERRLEQQDAEIIRLHNALDFERQINGGK